VGGSNSEPERLGTRILGYFCALMVAVMAVLLSIQVFGRYALHNPPDWTEELARVAFIYATFFGAALAVARKAHLGVELFATSVPLRWRAGIQVGWRLIACVALVMLTYYGYLVVWRLSGQPLTAVPISKGFMFAAVPLGCAIMLIYELRRIGYEMRKVVTGVDPDHNVDLLSRAEFIIHSHEDHRS
jgi:TRAP-type C4-dicarboxylate transport system permease small subunit